jgi:hypothetical protein
MNRGEAAGRSPSAAKALGAFLALLFRLTRFPARLIAQAFWSRLPEGLFPQFLEMLRDPETVTYFPSLAPAGFAG